RRHTRSKRDWSSDVCSSDLGVARDCCGKPVATSAKKYKFSCNTNSGSAGARCPAIRNCGGDFFNAAAGGSVGVEEKPANHGGKEIGRASCRERCREGWGQES